MKKAILSKTHPNGNKETYELTVILFDSFTHLMTTGIRRMYVDADGTPKSQDSQHNFSENFTINVMQPDPEWNALSDPPRPDGFDFDDPDTWGDLSIDRIPLVKAIRRDTRLGELYRTEVDASGEELGFVIEAKVLGFLQANGVLPADFAISDKPA